MVVRWVEPTKKLRKVRLNALEVATVMSDNDKEPRACGAGVQLCVRELAPHPKRVALRDKNPR